MQITNRNSHHTLLVELTYRNTIDFKSAQVIYGRCFRRNTLSHTYLQFYLTIEHPRTKSNGIT